MREVLDVVFISGCGCGSSVFLVFLLVSHRDVLKAGKCDAG